MQKQLNAYRQATHTVSKTRQVVMLYDGMIRFLQQACQAMSEKRIEDRFNLLAKTSNIIIGLQGSLDFQQSEEIASTLYDYYTSVDARVMALHSSNSVEDCETLIADLKKMRDVWNDIDQKDAGASSNAMLAADMMAAGNIGAMQDSSSGFTVSV